MMKPHSSNGRFYGYAFKCPICGEVFITKTNIWCESIIFFKPIVDHLTKRHPEKIKEIDDGIAKLERFIQTETNKGMVCWARRFIKRWREIRRTMLRV